jgi:Pregnancy-associated plasma protein-A
VTQAQIDEQIAVLNLSFGGFYGGANTRFAFRLAGVTRTVNAEWFAAGPGSPAARAMKQALTRGVPGALNYYSTTAGPYLGWAYLPGLTPSRQYLDGIVVDWESMPGTSSTYAGRYDLGFTATHEAGHWLGLEHTFFGGCNAKGDFVDDTPPMKVPTSGCPAGKDTCPEPGLDPIHNYMDYSYDSCYFEFTAGQSARMQDHYLHFRAGT